MKRRTTQQRRAVLAALRSTSAHPSADDVYAMVKQKVPQIGLATVYRNLEYLCQNDQAKIVAHMEQRRYDGKMTPHGHVICTECGRIEDIEPPFSSSCVHTIEKVTEYTITDYDAAFYGICSSCHPTHKGKNE